MGLGEVEDVIEVVMDGFQLGQAVAEPSGGSGNRVGPSGSPGGLEMVEVVLELREQGVRPTWETGGSDMGDL